MDELETLVATGLLHPVERREAEQLLPARRQTFVAGRIALRRAWHDAHLARHASAPPPDEPIVRSPRGAPLLPALMRGSLSHKATRAYAIAAGPESGWRHIGVDLERRPTARDLARPSIARRILTATEQRLLERAAADERQTREIVHVHFALKEAVYKAIDPIVGRYVGFTEVELALPETSSPEPATGGEAEVSLLLPELRPSQIKVSARWRLDGEWIVAAAGVHQDATGTEEHRS